MFPQGPSFRKINIDPNLDSEIVNKAINKEFIVFVMKFVLSFFIIIAGVFLIFKGITSESIIEFTFNNSNLKLNKAYPGTTLVIFGVLLMLFSRLNIRIK